MTCSDWTLPSLKSSRDELQQPRDPKRDTTGEEDGWTDVFLIIIFKKI